MGPSMGWMESLIFACAPTGIITAVVTAIRVGGPEALQAIIGRARESRAVVELELMSSTSAEQRRRSYQMKPGPWKAVRNEIVAVLGLWIYYLSESPLRNPGGDWSENEQALGFSSNYRIVGNGDPSNKGGYQKWLLPQTELVSTAEKNTIGKSNSHRAQCLARCCRKHH